MKNAGCAHTNPLTSTWPSYTRYVTLPSQNPCSHRHFSTEETEAQRGLFPASRCAGAALHAHQAGLEPNPGLRGMSALTHQRSSLDPGPWSLWKITDPFLPISAGTSPLQPQGGSSDPAISGPRCGAALPSLLAQDLWPGGRGPQELWHGQAQREKYTVLFTLQSFSKTYN